MKAFGDVYRNRRVLLTGHTGFKGSWLALWLKTLGAHTIGVGLEPNSNPSHWELLGLDIDDRRIDIRDASAVRDAVQSAAPEIVFHLAAQSLVRRSYTAPIDTWSTNVLGTTNVLEACRLQPSVRAIVVITSDKCYENREWEWGYRETDRLGGYDPYSASKAAAELVVSSYRSAFFDRPGTPLLGSARAGNVIGGGDWSEDRLIPDAVRAIAAGETISVRAPHATRPWQHVLESLSGYLCLGGKLIEGKREFAQAWNFGPDTEGICTVAEILASFKSVWPALEWRVTESPQLHEAKLLSLDSTKARQRLGWRSVWSLDQSLTATANWYQAQFEHESVISEQQLQAYLNCASRAGLEWCSE
jgi:CDP-glucose 4,6-dehydratase